MKRYILPIMVGAALLGLYTTAVAEHPRAEHPTAEHPRAEHPRTEHPEAEHPKAEHPKADLAEGTRVIGLLFYADWCAACKVLDPKLEAVKPEFADQPIAFTRVDLTDEDTTAKSVKHVRDLSLEKIYAEHEGRTGFVLLVDAREKRVLGRLTHDQSEGDLRQAISKALAETDRVEHPKAEHPTAGHPEAEHPRPADAREDESPHRWWQFWRR